MDLTRVSQIQIPRALGATADSVTNVSVVNSGRSRAGSAANYSVIPATPVPGRIQVRQHRTMAQRTPVPNVVDGRPS